MKELPIEYKELVKSFEIDFDYFIISGYNGSRYHGEKIIICGIYEYEHFQPVKDKTFVIDLKELFTKSNVAEMLDAISKWYADEAIIEGSKITVKESNISRIIDGIECNVRPFFWGAVKHTKTDEQNS